MYADTVGSRIILLILSVCALALRGATLYEGERIIVDARRAPIENGALLVDGGKVRKVGAKGTVTAPAGTARVDLSGKTVMPALIDTHIHIGFQKDLVYAEANYTRENLIDQLNRYAVAGYAAVMSLGTDAGDVPMQIRAEQAAGTLGGPRFYFAGRGIAAPNAGPGTPELKSSAIGVTSEAEARAAVREQVARKVDFIKIWVDDRNGTVKKLSPELYRAVIDEAHKRGTRVIAHIFYLDDAKDLARAGVDGFAHLVRDKEIDDEAVSLILQHHIFVMPNMAISENAAHDALPAWLDDPLLRELAPAGAIERARASFMGRSPESVERGRRTWDMMKKSLAKLNAAGATIGFGTDDGAVRDHFYAFSGHRDLALMVEGGMTPAQALTAATVTSAAFLKMNDHGTLEAGKAADFVVLDANPLEKIENTRKISAVYLKGERVEKRFR